MGAGLYYLAPAMTPTPADPASILEGPLFTAADLPTPSDSERRAPEQSSRPASAREAQARLESR